MIGEGCRMGASEEAYMIEDDDTDDVDAAVGVPEVDEEARDEDAMGLDDDTATISAAPDAAREEQTVLMTLAVVDWQYQEHGRENSWRVVDRSMVVFRVIDM